MSRLRPALLLVLLLLLLGPAALSAQTPARPDQPLEDFVARVAELWRAEQTGPLVALVPDGERLVLDTGEGRSAVGARHAAAALRALFGGRETLVARPLNVTFAGGSPPRGFGELAWEYRLDDVPTPQRRAVYVGAAWDGRQWRITELRVMN